MPLFRQPLCAARPAAALREVAVLHDQRHVATRDTDGNLALWDVTTACALLRAVHDTRLTLAFWCCVVNESTLSKCATAPHMPCGPRCRAVVRHRGQGELADVLRDTFEPVVVTPWFTADVSSGAAARCKHRMCSWSRQKAGDASETRPIYCSAANLLQTLLL